MTPRVLVTRPAAQADDLAGCLRDRGIAPIVVPTVAVDTTSTGPDLDAMIESLDGAAWLVITSANGARALAARLAAAGQGLPEDLRVAAVGPATADALRSAEIRVDHVPDEYLTAGIADGLGDVRGRRVVLARADAATPELHDALVARGARIEEVVAYRTIVGPPASRDPLRAALHADLAGTAFTSSSSVRGLLRLASSVDRGRARSIPAFCIGPITAGTARDLGFDIAAVAPDHTAAGLADAIADKLAPEAR